MLRGVATTIKLMHYVTLDGVDYTPGEVVSVADALATRLVRSYKAIYTNGPPSPYVNSDPYPQYATDVDLDALRQLIAQVTGGTAGVTSVQGRSGVVNLSDLFDPAGAAAAAKNRATHTGTQTSTTISDFTEAAQDAVAAMLTSGAGVTLTYNDTANTLNITATASGGDAETIRDTIGAALVGLNGVSVAVNDAADTITLSLTGVTIAQVTGLQAALDAKEPLIAVGTTAQYLRGDKTMQPLNKAAVGLGNVPNVDTSNASNITSGTLPTSVLPPLAINDTFPVASQAAMLALTAQRGDVAIRSDNGKTYILATDSPSTLADWKEILASGQVASVAGKTGVVALVVGDVSGAAPLASPAFTGAPTAPTPTTPTGIATKGYVDNADASLAPKASPTFTGTVTVPTPTNATDAASKGYVDGKAVQGTSISRTTDAAIGSLDTTITGAGGVTDDVLRVPVVANGAEFDIDLAFLFRGDPADDMKLQINLPAGTNLVGGVTGQGTGATGSGTSPARYGLSTYEGALPAMIFGTYTLTGQAAYVNGMLTVRPGTTAGEVTFTYSRNNNTSGAAGAGTPVKMLNGSSVRAQAA